MSNALDKMHPGQGLPPQPVLCRGRVTLRPSTAADCDLIVEIESHPDNAAHVGQWSAEQHLACMRSGDSAHWIVEADGLPIGYAVLQGVDDPDHSLLLRRIAIRGKGRGHGRAALLLVARYCFEVLGFHRLWLYVAVDNRRAHGVYRRLGFVQEGVARDSDRRADGYRSMYVLSLLEHEYRTGPERPRT